MSKELSVASRRTHSQLYLHIQRVPSNSTLTPCPSVPPPLLPLSRRNRAPIIELGPGRLDTGLLRVFLHFHAHRVSAVHRHHRRAEPLERKPPPLLLHGHLPHELVALLDQRRLLVRHRSAADGHHQPHRLHPALVGGRAPHLRHLPAQRTHLVLVRLHLREVRGPVLPHRLLHPRSPGVDLRALALPVGRRHRIVLRVRFDVVYERSRRIAGDVLF